MARPSSPALRLSLAALTAAVVAYFALRTPEPEATLLSLVASVCERAPSAQMSLAARHVAASVELSVDGGSPSSLSRADALAGVMQLRARHPGCSLSLLNRETEPSSEGVWVSGLLEFSASEAADLHAERRSLRALFRPAASDARLRRLELGRPERRLPEARP